MLDIMIIIMSLTGCPCCVRYHDNYNVTDGLSVLCCRKCLAAAFFMNAAELQKEGEYVTVSYPSGLWGWGRGGVTG